MIIEGFAGPGGWSTGARMIGLTSLAGIEWDESACLTRAAAGHKTIRCDITRFPVGQLAGRVTGGVFSPECITFSSAGNRAGTALLAELTELIRDLFAGKPTRAKHRNAMARALREANWPPPKTRSSKYNRAHKTPVHLTRSERSARIRKAVLSASLVAEPARFLAACNPEWVALEQVPSVLPLWRVYAAELRMRGYSAWCGVLNAADYGVPQTRERAILIASRVRRVSCPQPTHYDARKGEQLFGEPWVSMADALGWGATGRSAPTVTAGGTATGGAEPFGHRDRDALSAEREAGRWALRSGNQPHAAVRPAPAPAIAFGHNSARMEWVLHRDRGEGMLERDGRGRRDHPLDEPAPTITSAGAKPGANLSWRLRNNNNAHACIREADEPAGTLFFGHRQNDVSWVRERPATTVQGDPRVGRPGHKDRDKGESMFEVDSVRITVTEAAVLQSFPPDYPWQGTKTKQFEQVGNAVPPRLAAAVLGEAAGIDWQPLVDAFYAAIEQAA